MGGMLVGTVFGVLIIPGLYYIFGKMAEGHALIQDEQEESFSQEYVETISEENEIIDEIKKSHNQKKDQ